MAQPELFGGQFEASLRFLEDLRSSGSTFTDRVAMNPLLVIDPLTVRMAELTRGRNKSSGAIAEGLGYLYEYKSNIKDLLRQRHGEKRNGMSRLSERPIIDLPLARVHLDRYQQSHKKDQLVLGAALAKMHNSRADRQGVWSAWFDSYDFGVWAKIDLADTAVRLLPTTKTCPVNGGK